MKLAHTQLTENELQKRHYAFPEKRKFPLPDRDHVLSAIKFFNYASPNEEKILADAILKRMRELGMSDVNVGPTNKFRKYYSGPELKHYGVKGMKWGVWNEETKTRRSNNTLFVSGSSKTQSKDSVYYRKKLPKQVRSELKKSMKKGDNIIVGDAPGIDRQVQDYLNKKGYRKVSIYGPDASTARYKADKKWQYNPDYTPSSKNKPGSKEWLADKDIAMTNRASKGLAVVLDDGANATRRNVERLRQQGKESVVFVLSNKGKRKDKWTDPYTIKSES